MSGTKLLTSLFYIFFIFLGLIIAGCDSPSAPGNETSVFEAEFPANGADKQDINLTVAWTFSDTTAENVSYDLYLGTSFNPPLYKSGITEPRMITSMLDPNTIYFWRVRTISNDILLASSPLYRFTTGEKFTYPLNVGYWWEYEHTISYDNILPPSIVDRVYIPEVDTIRLDVVRYETLLDTLPVYALTASRPEGPDIYIINGNVSYMNNTDSGLYFFAYNGGTSIIPKNRVSSEYPLWDGWFGKSLYPQGIIYENPPPLCLPYPLEIGAQWIYRRVDGIGLPCRIDKKFLEWTDLTTPAGTFRCMKIQWLKDSDLDDQWDDLPEVYDYVSARGLVRRVYFYGNVMVYDENSPNVPIGWGDKTEEYNLTIYNLR